jgi:structure-specific endonuclease subunit SLX1
MWSVYLISDGTRTYVGCTTNMKRRLRQHNGEIKGGARATRGRRWHLVLFVAGFPNKSSAMTWEAVVKKRTRGLDKRMNLLLDVADGSVAKTRAGKSPPKKLQVQYE